MDLNPTPNRQIDSRLLDRIERKIGRRPSIHHSHRGVDFIVVSDAELRQLARIDLRRLSFWVALGFFFAAVLGFVTN